MLMTLMLALMEVHFSLLYAQWHIWMPKSVIECWLKCKHCNWYLVYAQMFIFWRWWMYLRTIGRRLTQMIAYFLVMNSKKCIAMVIVRFRPRWQHGLAVRLPLPVAPHYDFWPSRAKMYSRSRRQKNSGEVRRDSLNDFGPIFFFLGGGGELVMFNWKFIFVY